MQALYCFFIAKLTILLCMYGNKPNVCQLPVTTVASPDCCLTVQELIMYIIIDLFLFIAAIVAAANGYHGSAVGALAVNVIL